MFLVYQRIKKDWLAWFVAPRQPAGRGGVCSFRYAKLPSDARWDIIDTCCVSVWSMNSKKGRFHHARLSPPDEIRRPFITGARSLSRKVRNCGRNIERTDRIANRCKRRSILLRSHVAYARWTIKIVHATQAIKHFRWIIGSYQRNGTNSYLLLFIEPNVPETWTRYLPRK